MFKDKLKKMIGNDETQGNNKRKIENLVFLIVVLIITVVIINYVWSGDKSSSKNMTNSVSIIIACSHKNLIKFNVISHFFNLFHLG